MVCDIVQNGVKERQSQELLCQGIQSRAPQGLDISSQKTKAITKVTRVKKSKKLQRNFQEQVTPEYKLKSGNYYDVHDFYKSIWNAEYIGHEVIGHLILYCFLQGTQSYKFSEPAIRRGGKIKKRGGDAR